MNTYVYNKERVPGVSFTLRLFAHFLVILGVGRNSLIDSEGDADYTFYGYWVNLGADFLWNAVD